MPAILVSIKNGTWKKMKKHPEIKWTQVARQRIEEYADAIEGEISMDEFRKMLGPKIVKAIDSLPDEDPKKAWKEIKDAKWRRQALLTRALSSKAKQDS